MHFQPVTSWPLALVGKLIPVPERPFGDYFINIFASCKKPRNRGTYMGLEMVKTSFVMKIDG